jgi:hypothetical protein
MQLHGYVCCTILYMPVNIVQVRFITLKLNIRFCIVFSYEKGNKQKYRQMLSVIILLL